MDWLNINDEGFIETIKAHQGYTLIFKHSYTCSISTASFERFKRYLSKVTNGIDDKFSFYLVDVKKERPISLKIAETFGIQHESPQVLLIHNGKVIYHQSHNGIDGDDIKEIYQSSLASI
jgi:bacillithiol system protein YtxJ